MYLLPYVGAYFLYMGTHLDFIRYFPHLNYCYLPRRSDVC